MERRIDRLDKYITYKGLNDHQLTIETGLANGLLYKVRKNICELTNRNVSLIAQHYTDLNEDWLRDGIGSMVEGQTDESMTSDDKQNGIPLVPLTVMAGFNGIDAPGSTVNDCEYYQVPLFEQAGAEFLISVSGMSMVPKYYVGDILACKKVKDSTFLQWGRVYVIDSSQGAMVKRVQEDTENPDCIICVSDNSDYKPFKLPKTEIRGMYMVIGLIRME